MRILFVTSNRIGDAVLSTGLLDHLLSVHPAARVTVACGPDAAPLFARMPRCARIIVMEKRPYGRHWLPLWVTTVGVVWDLVVDIRASALAWLVPTRRRAVMRKGGGHKIEQLAAILRVSPAPLPVAWTAPEDRALAARLLGEGPIVALGPTANWDRKIWPPERFAALFRALAAGPLAGARALVLAGPGARERALVEPVLTALPGAIDLAGRLELPQAAACLARCALFVGNDSGLMHLAAAAGAPTLGLFGPTPAAEYAPAGRRTAVALSADGSMAGLPVEAALRAASGLVALAQAA